MEKIESEFSKRIVGNTDILRFMLKALFSGGHVLLEGVPGLGKTLMVKTMSEILDLRYRRIQFTPDLMPADITGTNIIVEDDRGGRHFRFERGPVFTQILLADEINRASPKTQSALLEAMEEHRVSVFGESHALDDVFFALATQNPIEMAGTYPLPEAQLDRFFFKLSVPFPSVEELTAIGRTNGSCRMGQLPVGKVLSRDRILEIREALCSLPVTDRVYEFASQLIRRTHPDFPSAPSDIRKFVKHGASPRGLIALIAASRVSAVLAGRINLSIDDLEENYLPSLRHRLVLGFEADLEKVNSDILLQSAFQDLRRTY
ncbi:MAG: AAA family ATPase [bacterium]|nr:MAG: AAA family ATPase [bacterium]